MTNGLLRQMTVSVVSFNTCDRLRDCLQSVVANSPNHVIVVDNGSNDGSIGMLQKEFRELELLQNTGNSGYGAALNRALRHSDSKYLLALNSDTVLAPNTVSALSKYLDENPTVAIVGPRLRNEDGTLQRSCRRFPGTLAWLLDNRLLARLFCKTPILRTKLLNTWTHDTIRAVPFVTGAAFAMRVDAIRQIGGFDERFFMYYEETDLAYRLSRLGWATHFAPVTDVVHFGGQSTRQHAEAMAEEFIVSTIRFYRQNYKGLQLLMVLAILKMLLTFRWIRDSVISRSMASSQRKSTAAALAAVWRRFVFQ